MTLVLLLGSGRRRDIPFPALRCAGSQPRIAKSERRDGSPALRCAGSRPRIAVSERRDAYVKRERSACEVRDHFWGSPVGRLVQ